MTNNVKISIITATWNSASTLQTCLSSISHQTYPHREHLIIDGGSVDGTLDVINDNINKISYFKSEPDRGIYDALNKGIKKSTGDVIGFLHADDFYASDNVLSMIAKAFEDPSVDAVYGDLDYVSQFNISKVVRHWKSKSFKPSDLGLGWMPAHPTLYVRREFYLLIGEFDISYSIAADYLSVLKLFALTPFKPKYLPNTLVCMRLGGVSNKSFGTIVIKTREDWRAMRSSGFSFPKATLAILCKNFGKIFQFI